MTKCGVADCSTKARTKGFCQKHYLRWRKHGDPQTVERIRGEAPVPLVCGHCGVSFNRPASQVRKRRKAGATTAFCSPKCKVAGLKLDDKTRFWAKVDKSGDCWLWIAGTDDDGYGIFSSNVYGTIRAHRFVYLTKKGPLEPEEQVCHSCDMPGCVRPRHLWKGTNEDNQADMATKGRYGNRPCKPGEGNIKAKVTESDVREIRRRSEGGELTTALAKEFGLSSGNVRAIVRKTIWKHVR